MSWMSALRARVTLLIAPKAADARLSEEIDFHIEMETERLMREGALPFEEARRRALVSFGGVTQHTETLRDERGLAWLSGLSLDFKLGFRMLRKYPGLTVVGGLAMAFAIWVGSVSFEMVNNAINPSLPLPNGDRIVQIRNWDVAANRPEPRAMHDFLSWRKTVSSVTDLGAYRDARRNLLTGGQAHSVQIAEISASAFRIASGIAILGRVLNADDEQAGAPPVVVIGYDVWTTRFDRDPQVIGRSVQLDDTYATVVGVMPKGFEFPAYHELWMPLRPDLLEQSPRAGVDIRVFGRLAPGASLESARAELVTVGSRMAAELPATHAHLQPQVTAYPKMFLALDESELAMLFSANLFAILLIVLICSNVALLLFARAATRESEIVVRSALGASRARIIMQLFAEALVLGAVAAAIGLTAAQLTLVRAGVAFLEGNLGTLPFWYDLSLSPVTILYSLGITVVAAAIAGILPAVKVTRGMGSRLKAATAGGGGLQFGGIWTAVIVTQIAFTVAFPAVAFVEQRELLRIRSQDVGFAAGEFLGMQVQLNSLAASGGHADSAREAHRARYGAALEALRQRLATEPAVRGVTFVDRLPRMFHYPGLVELDDVSDASASVTSGTVAKAPALQAGPTGSPLTEVVTASVDPSYFSVLQTPVLAGRAFNDGDIASEARVVIVDQGFVERVLNGRNPIGRRVRFAAPLKADGTRSEAPRPWYEIVGVVKDLGMGYPTERERAAGLYRPANLKNTGALHMMVHVQGDPMSFSTRLRELALEVEPGLLLSDLQRVDEVTNSIQWLLLLWLKITLALTGLALLLSLAGIYAVLSFTVARRTREIGVRVALGASRRRLIGAIFRKPLTQVAIGVFAGGALIAMGMFALSEDGFSVPEIALLLGYATFMMGVCLIACIVPTRRALGVEPMEALRVE